MNPTLQDWLMAKKDIIERKDGRGFLEILPTGDVAGAHGKSFKFVGFDEIHAYRDWNLLESVQPDPHRPDVRVWITSSASVFHRPGIPLFDLLVMGKTGTDPKLLFSWFAADYCNDPAFSDKSPEERANPSMASWPDGVQYLEQQKLRLPAHKFRRLHLNLPGLPEGSAYQPEPVMDAIERGVTMRPYVHGTMYSAFVDMSGGSSDDATLAIGHQDIDHRIILDRLMNQGQHPPFDPNKAVTRFCAVLNEYAVSSITLDRYAGLTFQKQFEEQGIRCLVAERTASQLYESFEPLLNSHRVVLLDVPMLEQQLLGLVWKGGKITHPSGEHDDWSNACTGVMHLLAMNDAARAAQIEWCLSVGNKANEPEPSWGLTPASAGTNPHLGYLESDE